MVLEQVLGVLEHWALEAWMARFEEIHFNCQIRLGIGPICRPSISIRPYQCAPLRHLSSFNRLFG